MQSSANKRVLEMILSGRSFINNRNSKGPSTEPCRNPLTTGTLSEEHPSTVTLWDLPRSDAGEAQTRNSSISSQAPLDSVRACMRVCVCVCVCVCEPSRPEFEIGYFPRVDGGSNLNIYQHILLPQAPLQ